MSEEPAKQEAARRRRMLRLSLATVLPVAGALALASVDTLQSSQGHRLPCPLYPNAVVAFAAKLHEGCPLVPGDALLAVEREGRREPIPSSRELQRTLADGKEVDLVVHRVQENGVRTISVLPVKTPPTQAWTQLVSSMLLAVLLLVFVLSTAVRANVPASLPFALIYSSVGVLLLAGIAGWSSTRSYPLTALARAVLPAAVAHLAFVFPRPREVAKRVPRVRVVPYWIAGGMFLLELNAAYRGSASTMLLLQRILMVALATAVSLLCLSSWLSMRESPSRLARGQAKVFLMGLGLLMAATLGGSLADLPGGPATAITLGAAMSLLPLGYAIASYHLFGFDTAWRRTVSHVLYLSLWSGLFFVGVVWARDRLPIPEWLRHPVVLYAGVYAVLAPLDGFRQMLKRFIERAFQPESNTWARLSEGRASKLAHLQQPEAIARAAVALAAEGAPNSAVSVFLGDGSNLRLAHATGVGACEEPKVASVAFRLAAGNDVVDLNRVDTIEPEAAKVYDVGVELVSVIATRATVHGVLLVCPTRRGKLHPGARITWLRMISVHAAAALENARLAEQLRVAEEFATRGRMHSELAHEIGKPLGALEVLAQKLSVETTVLPSVRERAATIARISGQLRDIVRGVLDAGRSLDRLEVGDVIERARLEISNVYGDGAVCVRPLPTLPPLERRADRVVRALTNLIDNAVRASPPGEPVEISARELDGGVEIQVADRGAGIGVSDLERVFDPFVSFSEGGNGLGLTISRQIVEQLGGSLVLESAPGEGTRAKLRLPAARGASAPPPTTLH